MDMEMMAMDEEEGSYPGLQFHPPDGLVGPEEKEGEFLARWEKVGDKFTITELNGKKVGSERIPPTKDEVEAKKERMKKMDAYSELDMMAQL